MLADGDAVELSNLQRQIAHAEADIGRNKASSAAAAIAELNPGVSVQVVASNLQEDTLPGLLEGIDLVVDTTDNYPIRFALHRACTAASIPLVSAAAVRSEDKSRCLIRVAAAHATAVCIRTPARKAL